MSKRALIRPALLLAACTMAGCARGGPEDDRVRESGGDPGRGRAAIDQYRCGACHVIPGVRLANGLVGPPLTSWTGRGFIAGMLPNEPESLARWIADPPAVRPGTAMPNLGVSQARARDIAAYLYTIR